MIDSSRALRAHERLGASEVPADSGLRALVRDSWQRSLAHSRDPDRSAPAHVLDAASLAEARRTHPLRHVLPVVERLLAAPAAGTGLLVAIADECGRMLWVLGDEDARRRASAMGFEPGMDWSEASIGTSAPGTALAVDASVQIAGAEHFSRAVHPWSCTAVPVHDPHTGRLLGVVDLTGDEDAVARHSLPLVEAAVAAAQAEIRVLGPSWEAGAHGQATTASAAIPTQPLPEVSADGAPEPASAASAEVRLTGPEAPLLVVGGQRVRLRLRHAEILAILALHPDGLASADLAAALAVDGEQHPTVTLRAEIARLRRVLDRWSPTLALSSRPYRLPAEMDCDFTGVDAAIAAGDLGAALTACAGPLLPESEAAAIVDERARLAAVLRTAVLESADADELYAYLQRPEAHEDEEAWRLALRLLPADSPKRALALARLEDLTAEA